MQKAEEQAGFKVDFRNIFIILTIILQPGSQEQLRKCHLPTHGPREAVRTQRPFETGLPGSSSSACGQVIHEKMMF